MTGTIIGILFLIIQAILLFKNIEKGTVWSLIFIMIAPNIYTFGYEVPGTFLLLFAWLLMRGSVLFSRKVMLHDVMFSAIVVLVPVMAIVGTLVYGSQFNVIGTLGYIRMLLLLFVLREFFAKNGSEKLITILNVVIVVNFIVSVLQITIDSSVQIFYDLYWRPSMTPLEVMVNIGSFSRAFGTFATPLYLSCLVLIAYPIYFYKWLTEEKSTKWLLFVAITAITGLLCLSKTTYLGLAGCSVLEYVLIVLFRQHRKLGRKTLLLVLFGAAVVVYLLLKARTDASIRYYLSYFKNPLAIFTSRYGDSGNLAPLKEVVKEHFFFGVGMSPINGEFIGDSAYFVTMHDIGFIGLLLYMVPILTTMFVAFRNKDTVSVMLLLLFLLMGLGLPIFTNTIGMIYLGYAMARNDKIHFRRNAHLDQNIALCQQHGTGRH